MWLVSFLAVIILVLSFFGGLKEGAVKYIYSLVITIIAIPVAGAAYDLIAGVLSFLPGSDWENFIGFFVAMALASIVLHFVFLLPRKFAQKVWRKGTIFRLLGGLFNVFNVSIGLVVFTLVMRAYPIWGWLEAAVSGSGVMTWLVAHLGFVQALLPELFQHVSGLMSVGLFP